MLPVFALPAVGLREDAGAAAAPHLQEDRVSESWFLNYAWIEGSDACARARSAQQGACVSTTPLSPRTLQPVSQPLITWF